MIRPDRKSEPGEGLFARNLSEGSGLPLAEGRSAAQKRRDVRPTRSRQQDDGTTSVIPEAEEGPKARSQWPGDRPKSARRGAKAAGDKKDRPARAPARAMTQQRIRNIAEHYVASRECSEGMLRDCLERRLEKRLRSLDPEEAMREAAQARDLIAAEIKRLVSAGLISDSRYAEMKVRSGLGAGRGRRRIMMDLASKSIAKDVAEAALLEASRELTGTLGRDDVDDNEVEASAEWEAAETFARKKRYGPYRSEELPDDRVAAMKIWRKEASAMARRGFGFDIIRGILDREPDGDDD